MRGNLKPPLFSLHQKKIVETRRTSSLTGRILPGVL